MSLQLRCETDFVARNPAFGDAAATMARACLSAGGATGISLQDVSLDELMGHPTSATDSITVGGLLGSLLATVGEKVELSRGLLLNAEGGAVGAYSHPGGAYGSLVAARVTNDGTVDDKWVLAFVVLPGLLRVVDMP